MKIIFNADDFGITDAVSFTILDLFKTSSLLRSTTVMINLLSDDLALALGNFIANNKSGYSVGMHFNLTCAKPVRDPSKISSLVDEKGTFLKFDRLIDSIIANRIEESDIESEFIAQIELFHKKLGFWPSHIDSHKHVHMMPSLFKCISRKLAEYPVGKIRLAPNISAEELFTSQGVAAGKIDEHFSAFMGRKNEKYSYGDVTKLACPDLFFGTYTVGSLSAAAFARETGACEQRPAAVCEYMVHPGTVDAGLEKLSSLLAPREKERDALKGASLAAAVKESGFEVISYNGF